MGALDAVMSLLPRRRAGKHEVARYTLSDFFNWRQSALFNGHQYGLGGAYGVTTTYGNQPAEPIGNSFDGYVAGLLYADGPVAAAEAYRLRVFGQAPLLYQKRVDGRPGDLYDDPRLDLVRAPWTGGTAGDLMKRALLYGDFGGNAYVVVIDDEVVLLRPDWVEIVLAKRMYDGYQVGWRQVGIAYYEGGLGNGAPAVFLPGEYVHFVPGMPDPLATWRGMSWLTPVIREIQSDKSATEHKLKFFENAATPNLAVALPKEVSPAQFNAFVDKMNAGHQGVDNAYKTLYVGGGADVTVIGANMQQMDFGSIQGKIETRIANAAGVSPVLLSFSEGMQGSSLNAGNYVPAKRNFVDTTMRDLWQNWCGSLETLLPPPNAGDRLWYDPRDIPFLHEDQTDVAQIKQIEAATMNTLVTAGWEKASIIAAVTAGDWTLLADTGLVSVQLLPPGTTATDTAKPTTATRSAEEGDEADDLDEPSLALLAALGVLDAEVERRLAGAEFNAAHLRGPDGRFIDMVDRLVDAIDTHRRRGGGSDDPFDGFNREQLRRVGRRRGLTFRRGASRDEIAQALLGHLSPGSTASLPEPEEPNPLLGRRPSAALRLGHALNRWQIGEGPDDPTEGFTREQLRRGALDRGIQLPRGASVEHIREALLQHTRGGHRQRVDATPSLPGLSGMISQTDEAQLTADVKRVFEGNFGGLSTTVTSVRRTWDGHVKVTGTIHAPDGREVGIFNRHYSTDRHGKLIAHHDYLSIDAGQQGSGFSNAFNGHLIRWYRESGVKEVHVHADIDVGGYAWARGGYDFAGATSAGSLMGTLRTRVAAMEHTLAGGGTGQSATWGRGRSGTPTRIPRERLAEQIRAAREFLDRADRTRFGAPDYPSAYELSQLGRWHGAGRMDRWIGNEVMLGSDWQGVLRL